MINPRISAVWSTTKPIAPFSCTPGVHEVHNKPEVVHLTPGLLGFIESLQFGVRKKRLHHSLVHHVYMKDITNLRSYTLPLVSYA